MSSSSYALTALVAVLSLSVIAAQKPNLNFTAMPQPPWGPRILQGFAFPQRTVSYTVNGTLTATTASPSVNTIVAWGGAAKSSGSRPQQFNDVYISIDGAQTWQFIGGQSAQLPQGYPLSWALNGNNYVYTNATTSAGLLIAPHPFSADDQDSCKYYDKATNTYFVFDTINAYTSTDLLTWTTAANSEYLGHQDSLCYTDGATRVYIISGSDGVSGGYQNDVWSSTIGNIASWTAASAYAPWTQRDSMTGFSTVSQGVSLLYAMGGHDKVNNVRSNEVWVSANAGVNWTNIANASWTGRDHAAYASIVTPTNVIVLLGGKLDAIDPVTNNNLCVNDVWASLDGGMTWGFCGNGTWPPRQDHSASLSPDGYVYISGGWQNKTVYWSDLWKSSLNVSNVTAVAATCGLSVPNIIGLVNGSSLIGWNTTVSSSSSSGVASTSSGVSTVSSSSVSTVSSSSISTVSSSSVRALNQSSSSGTNSAHGAAAFSLGVLVLTAALSLSLL